MLSGTTQLTVLTATSWQWRLLNMLRTRNKCCICQALEEVDTVLMTNQKLWSKHSERYHKGVSSSQYTQHYTYFAKGGRLGLGLVHSLKS